MTQGWEKCRIRKENGVAESVRRFLSLLAIIMFARQSLSRVAAQTSSALAASRGGARNMATLREIELRLKSVRNIQKITGVRPPALLGKLDLFTISADYENDCVRWPGQGSACHGGRQTVR